MSYRVLMTGFFYGATDGWTEFLCVEALPDGRVELSSRSREALASGDWTEGDVVYPEGVAANEDLDEEIKPLTIAGKPVWGRDDDFWVGEELVPHSDDAAGSFRKGEGATALAWLNEYGWSRQPGFAQAWREIESTIDGGPGPLDQGMHPHNGSL